MQPITTSVMQFEQRKRQPRKVKLNYQAIGAPIGARAPKRSTDASASNRTFQRHLRKNISWLKKRLKLKAKALKKHEADNQNIDQEVVDEEESQESDEEVVDEDKTQKIDEEVVDEDEAGN